MIEEIEERAQTYAAAHGLVLGKTLGSGIHGTVYRAKDNAAPGRFALKFHEDRDAYIRECDVYRRLAAHGIRQIAGFNVPQMLYADDDWLVIAMTIVRRPFTLDYASAYLDKAPRFSEEALAEWEEAKREQFGDRWETVQLVLHGLRDLGVHQTDASPGNVGFAD